MNNPPNQAPENPLQKNLHVVLSVYVMFVFIQSLFFKFTGSPETVYIFEGKLEPWAAGLGFPGLFAPGGIFSAVVVGSAELLASALLLLGLINARLRLLQAIGAVFGLGIISGAIFFHLFTPLGVEVVNTDGTGDGGTLFFMACGVWLACLVLIGMRRDLLRGLLPR